MKILKSGNSLAHSSEDQTTTGHVLHYMLCLLLGYPFGLTFHHEMRYENSDAREMLIPVQFGKDFPLNRFHP